ncbi:organic hydroperoxide resistance protein [Saccharopolyspora endophytica]|uniref:Organic hydroperoxide resistance protein n=1 Tax=Saccharopolyspora endophytica TaxID=543886 RepID=A0ABS5DG65_9PSEU|nr:organic hydroperoxide resistance protein [Saccharopolyspora endophytica]MBQ0925215.1 organic hydroperoxide resistance protein [Saccharopolyspora endophytica]
MTVLYTAEATATGEGRSGRTRTSDGLVDLELAIPKEMGGPGGATNPEQLFAAGYSACFHSALQLVARKQKVDIEGSTVTAEVGIGPNGDGGFALNVALLVELPGVPEEQAQQLAEAADAVCPYSNAVRGNIALEVRVA